MAIYPGAVVKLVPRTFPRATVRNRVNLHTAVSNLDSLYNMFSKPTAACSHFYVREDGTVEQYIDTDRYSAADLDGNDATISIETWDGYGRVPWPGGQPPAWTPAQVSSLVALCRWICTTHGIPPRMADDAKPGESSRGISWHRLGVDGAFPRLPDIRAGRLQRGGGMHYSSALGKVCPGDARIEQIPGIVAALVTLPPPSGKPRKKVTSMPVIYRAGGYPSLGVLAHNGGFVVLKLQEEVDNLTKAGAKIVWLDKATLDNLIADVRA